MKKIFLSLAFGLLLFCVQAQDTVQVHNAWFVIENDNKVSELHFDSSIGNAVWQSINNQLTTKALKADDIAINIKGTEILCGYNAEHDTYFATLNGVTDEYNKASALKSAMNNVIKTLLSSQQRSK